VDGATASTDRGGQPAELYRPTSWPALIVAVTLALIPLIALSQFMAWYRTDVVDDQMFAYFGWRIAHGAVVYRDVWDNKPPGIYWVNALAMLIGRDSYAGVIAICVLALVVAHGCFLGVCASLFYRGAAAITTVLLGFYLTHGYYTGGTNRTETFLVACELAAVLCYVRGFARPGWGKWYACGLLCGAAFLFKQVGLAAFGAMLLHTGVLTVTRILRPKQAIQRIVLVLAGAMSTVAVAALALSAQGALKEAWFAAFGFNLAYFATGTTRFPYRYFSYYMLKENFFPILRLPLLMAAAASIHAALWALRPHLRPPEIAQSLQPREPACPRYMLLFVFWAVLAFWAALLSPHAFRHYLVPVIPPLLLVCGYLVNILQAEMRLLVRFQQRIWTAGAFVAIAFFISDAVRRQWEEFSKVYVPRFIQHERAEWEVIGDVVRMATGPQDRIQCWGYYPGVYLHARRINAVRYTTTEKVGQVRSEADFVMHELEQRLKANPPVVLVVSAADYEWLHGRPGPGRAPPAVLLGPWIDEHYERIADIPLAQTAYVYKRKDLLTAQDRKIQEQIPNLLRG